MPSSVNSINSLLSSLSVSARPEGEREEPSGNGTGVSIRNVIHARNMDSLSTRLEITSAVERNKTQPMERVEGYNVTRANDVITVVRNERLESEEERYYDARTLPDTPEWMQMLRKHRQSGTKFTVCLQILSFRQTRRHSTVM
uniref:Uncharacterized protein n=1 Tax=Globisporangium ultimum (strain ATCC 200006 / CBS 805.95 / DAOM BR144) TaxID=431595 RepID=K3W871_GLOUD